MTKLKSIGYIALGIFLCFLIQELVIQKTTANNFTDSVTTYKEDSPYTDFTIASEKALQAVVHIKSKLVEDEIYGYFDPLYGRRYFKQPRASVASGSGVIISEDGYIVTNKHVINDAKEIEVVLHDKRTYTASILGQDPSSDLALLKIQEDNLNYLDFDDSNNLKVGQWVLAVGNPMNLNSTVTAGIISAKARKINILNDGGIESFIQTDAAINSGNSGGALVNTRGNLIGINTAIQSTTGSFSGYGFAIPSNMVEKIVNDLKNFGEVRRAYIGIHIVDITTMIQKELDLDDLKGVLISKVMENSAAQKVGLQDYDVILEINDFSVNSTSELHEIIIQFDPGEEIKCTIKRNGKIQKVTLSLQS